MNNLSRSALLNFLDYLANKGLMNRATVTSRKAAVSRVLSILDPNEAEDISRIDVDSVMARFHNLEGAKFTPESLSVYRSRVKASIEDFLKYQKDPLNFKPGIQSQNKRSTERTKSNQPISARTETVIQAEQAPPASVNILPIPIRIDLTIKIQGLPFDLTAAEANKIANVVKALAIPD